MQLLTVAVLNYVTKDSHIPRRERTELDGIVENGKQKNAKEQ